eukprot:6193402-Pleurochrysis_carterae.AAC.2
MPQHQHPQPTLTIARLRGSLRTLDCFHRSLPCSAGAPGQRHLRVLRAAEQSPLRSVAELGAT